MSRRTLLKLFLAGVWGTLSLPVWTEMVRHRAQHCTRQSNTWSPIDLADGGCHHFAETIIKIKQKYVYSVYRPALRS